MSNSLSDDERKILAALEEDLHSGRRSPLFIVTAWTLLAVVGLVLMVAGVALNGAGGTLLGLAGFLLGFAGVYAAMRAWRNW